MAVAIYARVSTEEQRERQSIRTQLEFAERYRQLHSLATYRVYADDGISGAVPLERRPEGSQILQDAAQGKFNQLLVYRLDRLGRETRLILNAVAELEKLGVRIRSMTEDFDTSTATGRLMLTLLAGFAAHERDAITARSIAGTFRVAEGGAWLGGIVPFGYRKEGEKRNARLVLSEEHIPGVAMSEVEVIRDIYRLAAVEGKSCIKIADRLNQMRVPCAYVRDDRLLLRGKRKERTSGLLSPGRIRNMITNKTYMGVHEFGKRSSSRCAIVTRPVPAIVTPAVWKKAQETLASNLLFCPRGARNKYLLRGLIKCSHCGLNYIGMVANRANAKSQFYYKCNGVHSRAVFQRLRERCPSKAVRGDPLEKLVWADVEGFLRNPGPILEQLRSKLEGDVKDSDKLKDQQRRLEGLVAAKATERSRVVGLYRRGRLTDADLDEQMNEIGKEQAALEVQLAELKSRAEGARSIGANVATAGSLLAKLRKRLDEPVSWEVKRQLIEVLLAGIAVGTIEQNGVVQPRVTVRYRFDGSNQVERIIPPQEYLRRPIRIPAKPQSVGDHLRVRRLGLKMLQKDVAKKLGIETPTIQSWESNIAKPHVEYFPAIIEFLGYNPLPKPTNWAERLVRARTAQGLTQKAFARRLEVDPSTLAKWERGEREPKGEFAARAEQALSTSENNSMPQRRAG
jgi:site-specific DNA recombinase